MDVHFYLLLQISSPGDWFKHHCLHRSVVGQLTLFVLLSRVTRVSLENRDLREIEVLVNQDQK